MGDDTMGFEMATLTEVSGLARKGVKFGAIFLVVLMLIPGIWRVITTVYKKLNPPPPPPPTVRYGKLPVIKFPEMSADKIEYTLETIEGGLPGNLPTIAKAYITSINRSRLATPDKVRDQARKLGFTNDVIPVDEQTYRFVHPTLPAEVLVNIISNGFSYKFDWTTEKDIAQVHEVPLGNQAIAEARTFFTGLGILAQDLVKGSGKFQYMIATGSAMV